MIVYNIFLNYFQVGKTVYWSNWDEVCNDIFENGLNFLFVFISEKGFMNKVDFEFSSEESLEMYVDQRVDKGQVMEKQAGEIGRNGVIVRCDNDKVDG